MAVYLQTNQTKQLLDAANVISASDTGKLMLIPVLTNDRVITLPTIASGLHYRFMISVAAGGVTPTGFLATLTPAAGGNPIFGYLITLGISPITTAGKVKNAAATAVFAATAVTGDYIDCYCDGTFWHVSGMSQIAAGIT